MKNIVIFSFAAAVALSSCKKPNELETKKAELAEAKKQFNDLKVKIETLEKELAGKGIDSSDQNSKDIRVAVITPQDFKHFIEVQGKIDSDKNILVNPEINGTIERVYVKVGDQVKKGQLIAQMDGSLMLQGIEELRSQLEFAKTLHDKQKRLWDQKIGTEVQYLSAKNNLTALEKKMATVQRQYNMTRVIAPISGTVDEVKAREGELASPMIPMVRLVNLSDFKVVAEITEAYVSKVKRGDAVKLTLPDINKDITGTVSEKSDVIDPMNRTFKVEVKVNGGQASGLRPNMIAKVKVNDYTNSKAIVIPVNTIQSSENGDYVYIAEKQGNSYIAKQQPVKRGVIYGDMVEILDGLKAGDQIITVGFQDMTSGQVVKF